MKKLIACLFVAAFCSVFAFSQIVTATAYFNEISDRYEEIITFECDMAIVADGKKMSGHVLYRRPEMVRVDFSSQRGQVAMFDGNTLIIYLPSQQTLLQQVVNNSDAQVSPRGLTLLRRYYSVSFETSAEPVPLDEGSSFKVVNLLFTRRAASEAFSTIKMSIDPSTKLIRRIVATTPQNKVYRFDFTGYGLNVRITDERFMYDPPSSINAYNNFLFQE